MKTNGKIFIEEFGYFSDKIVAFIRELTETIHNSKEYKYFRTAENCNLRINYEDKSVFVIMPFDTIFDDI